MDGDWSKEISLIGIRIYVGGIALQQVFILGFVILLVKFHLRAERGYADPARNDGWRYLIPSIYAVIALISVSYLCPAHTWFSTVLTHVS